VTLSILNPTTVHSTTGYSHAARIGDLVFVSGQVSQDLEGNVVGKGDIRAQVEQVYANLRAVLEAAGSGFDLIGKTTVFTTSLEYRPVIAEVRSRLFESLGHVPASTFVVVSSLANPDWLVEIEAVAAVR
jgi:enamine deaminase RidA (YjgF/YER057c/UK114 family)